MSKITKLNSKAKPKVKRAPELKAYLGFEYVKLNKDVNGFEFSLSHLQKYANAVKYIIAISRQVEGKTFVYNFYVENSKIKEFFENYLNGKIEGEIIDIDKVNPENLA